jgi:DNA-binding GntR family transcriptional regulator
MSDRKGGGDLIADDVRAKLRSMILGSEFRPGQRLVEDDLCATLGVGRTPVREALLLLQGEGYLARERGWVVRDVDRSKVNAIFESRAAIEGATARLAASRISRADCDKLDAMIDIMEPSKKLARPELNQINTRFHNAIVEAADNPLLVEFHKRTQFFYWMLRVPVLFGDDEVRTTNNQHRRIVRALKRRDGDEAERASREHVEATMAIVVPALRF